MLDIGCGFGLFSLYFALRHPHLQFVGVDLNAARVATARRTAARLGVTNVTYSVADASSMAIDSSYEGVYMLDVAHHIPQHTVRPLLAEVHRALVPGGRFVLKDVDTEPAYKRWFTWLLDRMMDRTGPLRYWPRTELTGALREAGFEVFSHAMPDILPYPHLLYICRTPGAAQREAAGA